MTSPRIQALADQIHAIVATTLEEKARDPRLGFVTITEVRLTGDASEASVFYTVYGDEEARKSSAAALKSATGMLRTAVAKRLPLRQAPRLEFILDATADEAKHLEDVLARARAKDAEVAAAAAEAKFAGDEDPYRKPDADQ